MKKFQELISGDQPVLVDFFASWCGPCKMMHPIIEELKRTVGDSAHILTIDIDNHANAQLVQLYDIRSVPTLIIFRRGEQLWRQSGVISGYKLQTLLIKYGEIEIEAQKK